MCFVLHDLYCRGVKGVRSTGLEPSVYDVVITAGGFAKEIKPVDQIYNFFPLSSLLTIAMFSLNQNILFLSS